MTLAHRPPIHSAYDERCVRLDGFQFADQYAGACRPADHRLTPNAPVTFLPSGSPTPILRRLDFRRITSLGLRVAIELPAWQVIDAPLARVWGEVSLDAV